MHRIFLCLSLLLLAVRGALLGIDFGTNFVKVALLKPGSSFSIVLDETSKRKSPTMISFDTDQRQFGNSALSLSIKRPLSTFLGFKSFLGQHLTPAISDHIVSSYYPYSIVNDTQRYTLRYTFTYRSQLHNLTTEELVAMDFYYLRSIAAKDSNLAIEGMKDTVITVPPFFSLLQKQCLIDAAHLAGLNVISLVHDPTAAAVEYGIHMDHKVDQQRLVLFYDMGAGSTKASLVRYSAVTRKLTSRSNDTVGRMEVLATAYDQGLGGNAFDLRLMNHFADEFQSQIGASVVVKETPKIMSKLRKTCTKVKEILSANQEHPVRIEGLYEDTDFSSFITRDKFYEMSRDLFERVRGPIDAILEESRIPRDQIDAITLLGGGIRIPEIQRYLKEEVGFPELNQNLNGDEAMALGAGFVAANRSAAYRVRRFEVTERLLKGVQVEIRQLDGNAEEKEWYKLIDLFAKGDRAEVKKMVSLKRHKDLKVVLLTADDTYTKVYNVMGIDELAQRYEKVEDVPKITLTFAVGLDGIPSLLKGEAMVQQLVEKKVPKVKEEKEEKEKEEKQEKEEEKEEKEEKEEEIKIVKKKRFKSLKIESIETGLERAMNESEKEQSQNVLKTLQDQDEFIRETGEALNRLESYIYSMRSRVREEEEIAQVSTEEQREELIQALNIAEDWLYESEEIEESPAKYTTKYEELQKMAQDIETRVKEIALRSKATVRMSKVFGFVQETVEKIEKEMSWIPEYKVDSLKELTQETKTWFEEQTEAQGKKESYEMPVYSGIDALQKADELMRLAKKVFKYPKPAPPKKEKNETKTEEREEVVKDEKKDEEKSESEPEPEPEESEEKVKEEIREDSSEKSEL